MKDTDITAQVIASLRSEIDDFVKEESGITDSIAYEERVLELSRKFARSLIAQTRGKMPKSRNSKKKC